MTQRFSLWPTRLTALTTSRRELTEKLLGFNAVRHDLVAPAVLPYEIGNALSSLVRRKVLAETQLTAAWDAAAAVPVELAMVDARAALLLAGHFRIYAYDPYFLQCSLESKCPLLTMDGGMKRVAKQLDITLVE